MKTQKWLSRTSVSAVVLFCVGPVLPAFAGTHWVSPTGTASYSSCIGSTPLSGTPACSLSTANAGAVAGDLIYLRAGTYNLGGGVGIQPVNGGTSPTNRITFMAYTGETPTLSGGSDPFWLSVSYIVINGITFSGQFTSTWGRIRDGGSHNEIVNCLFTTNGGGGFAMMIEGGSNQEWATNNWIHANHFVVTGQAHGTEGTGCTDGGGDVLDIGSSYGAYSCSTGTYCTGGTNNTDLDNNNTIENNFFEHAPHAAIESYGEYNVIRNNIIHNEPWSAGCTGGQNSATYSSSNPNYSSYNGSFAHRDSTFDDDFLRTAVYLLIEGNRFGYAGVNQDNDGGDDLTLAAPQNILRYNFMYASMNPGLLFKGKWNGGLGSFGNGGTYNRVYNNTFYQNGYGYPWGLTCTLSTCPWPESAVSIYEGSQSSVGDVLKNNVFYLSAGYTKYGSDVMDKGAPSNGWSEIGFAMNNWCSGTQTGGSTDAHGNTGCSKTGNPLFNNPDLSNPASQTLPDLTLQATSPAIDGGTYLTTATNSGTNSKTLTVADALYFQDGTWGSDLSRAAACLGGTMQADSIAIGTVTNVVKISSVTYGTYSAPAGTITLASPMSWSNGAPIWLYSKSDGSVVLVGAAPDYGASEYGASSTPTPPTCFKAVLQ